MEIIKGGVTAAKGFKASGIHVGLRRNVEKKDLALVYSDVVCNAAAVYTQNRIKGNPIYVTQDHIKNGKAQAIIINSANANTFNGKDGLINAYKMTEFTSEKLSIKKEDVLVASTGVIGEPLKINLIEQNMDNLVHGLSKKGHLAAREAIMTTDMIKKEMTVSIQCDEKEVIIGGMAKGSGMIHPNMATVLGFITTDLNIEQNLLQEAISSAVKKSFNRISVDGQTSTNDMVIILANGKAENKKIKEKNEDYRKFLLALTYICKELAKCVAKDGEGASKLIECEVSGSLDEEIAAKIAKAVITSTLVKTAVFGSDANWGRILCAIGCEDVHIDLDKIDVTFESKKGYLEVCKRGVPLEFNEDKAKKVLGDDEITILIELNMGEERATAWGCDLTYEYVRINGSYRS
ncbi:bifunctional glutamate N-acetyltransferase/amino-acid acetyltransferase ArgJ [Terrisporobacter vanillatitrophus]|uniref:bifunctional glutamate N-acetyltransferase/amino-acid acetyltransferase ArgJ n=1 Tax=Terrisporobacter vanillatitrophus TaxID=3058402 RepID=UPI003368A870